MSGLTQSIGNVLELLLRVYRKAPVSILTLSSILVSYIANVAYYDFRLFQAVGAGGFGEPTFRLWLLHALVLNPLSMSKSAARDPTYLPLDDIEWEERVRGSGRSPRLADLPKRGPTRPTTYGFVPHRQIESVAGEGSDGQKVRFSSCQHDMLADRDSLTTGNHLAP
jgi:hypothetical protein